MERRRRRNKKEVWEWGGMVWKREREVEEKINKRKRKRRSEVGKSEWMKRR